MAEMTSLRRQIKNVAYNYSDAQVKVREATSNDPWGPSSTLMSEIADMTYNSMAFTEIMQMIWKRLNDHGKYWRHVYKSLVLLDYLVKTGSEKVAQQCKENIYAISTLKDFQHYEDNKDQGANVREKAKQLANLLKDDERLRNERARAIMARKRFAQNGIGSDGRYGSGRRSESDFNAEDASADPELEGVRPSTAGEEELQLQIAIALSKEEAQKEEEMRKGDEARLQIAVEESRRREDGTSDEGAGPSGPPAPATDLLAGLYDGPSSQQQQPGPDPWGGPAPQADPWGASAADYHMVPPPTSHGQHHHAPPAGDPWGSLPSSPPAYTNGMGLGHGAIPEKQSNDPWAAPAGDSFAEPDIFGAGAPNQQTSSDPWGIMSSTGTEGGPGGQMGGMGAGSPPLNASGQRNLKTPESFLGENSALVNLDNLVGPPKPPNGGGGAVAPTANPFLMTSGVAGPQSNPFAAQQRPSPTLNQMAASTRPPAPVSAGGAQGWGGISAGPGAPLPQPLQPARPTAGGEMNPFL